MASHNIPIIARGQVIEDYELEFNGRHGAKFRAPDVLKHLPALLPDREEMARLYDLTLDDILAYLARLIDRLAAPDNPHLEWAFALAEDFSDVPASIMRERFAITLRTLANPAHLEAMIRTVGRENLDGWNQGTRPSGRISHVRAMGVPTVHAIAGNGPSVSIISFVNNALIRGYALVKLPSNEPALSVAVARTAIDMDPDHPLSKSFSVAYWRGGDERVESRIYNPRHFEKIAAWGGFATLKHLAGYIRPGLELVAFDPKISRAILGRETLQSDVAMREAAVRLAADVGYNNQNSCASCRVAYIVSDSSPAALKALERFGQYVYDEIQMLPVGLSSAVPYPDAKLAAQVDGLAMLDDEFRVIGGDRRGSVIVSLNGEQVDFADDLKDRILNIVPVADYREIFRYITRDVQSVGVYPEYVRDEVRTPLALRGAQRITSLGFMNQTDAATNPHDGMETLRRLTTWIVAEDGMTNEASAPWRARLTELN